LGTHSAGELAGPAAGVTLRTMARHRRL